MENHFWKILTSLVSIFAVRVTALLAENICFAGFWGISERILKSTRS